ncbi:efflux RND transporter permease subunit [Aliiroseovarius sp.]|uniref:efflux RND transporter permease subunit n=1 Tax=Aliiroseovarius sp. TaxID=1872442 RepID=UPI003BA8EFAC
MVNIARASIEKPLYTWLIMLTCLLGGIYGFFNLGRLEDPAFTIKSAVVTTIYPGATAQEVATEVSEPLESAIQKMGELDRITSINRPGFSQITVEVQSTFDGDELPAIWTDLRNKVNDAAAHLPSGVQAPVVNDGFGDVFGLFYAVTAEGFTDAEKHDLATFLRRELLAVDGVADVEISGLPDEAIFVEPNPTLVANLGVSVQAVADAIATADSVAPAGSVDRDGREIAILTPDGSDTVDAIAGLSVGVNGNILNLVDLAAVSRGRIEDPSTLIRFNGVEAFTLGIAGLSTENIVEVGHRVDARLAELSADIPVGVELLPIYQQHLVVEQASNDFLVNLATSVAIVVIVLALFMGWRAGVVIGATLLLTVVGTLLFMWLFSIEMERISLGALIIAMGMLVDNAIVVAEGMQIAMIHGRKSKDAADDAAAKTQIPLLGATVIGIMAFAGIGLSPDATGEFLFSLFAVIGISLLLSWVLAITVTPLLGHYLFKQGNLKDGEDAYGGFFFRIYKGSLRLALRARLLVVLMLIGITVACYAGFGLMKQQFFPNSNTPLFFVHYKLPQGTSIHTTSDHLKLFETWLAEREDVVSVASFVGQGATRFMLTYESERPNPSYGHLIIRTEHRDDIPALQADLEEFGRAAFPEGEFRTKRLVFGPGGGDPIQVRFSGSDPDVLRELAAKAQQVMAAASPNVLDLRTNWRERELVVKPIYSTQRAQRAGVTRDDVAQILEFSTDGFRGGTFRENERLIPIIIRRPQNGGNLMDQQGYSALTGEQIPMEQLIEGFTYEVQDTLVHRRNRLSTISVGADVPADMTAASVFSEVQAAVEAMDLPVGYRMEWGGEHESSSDANESLGKQLPVSLLIMVLISILLFNALKQPIIIWLLVPMSVNGVVLGLLGTDLPFTFTALLGMLSLSGMLIKNGIVLVEEIDLVCEEGLPLTEAVVKASVSRLRPVFLAAVTTILGMAPLLGDAFFRSMAVTIMGGLAFASILTLVAAPVLYHLFFARSERRALAKKAKTEPTPA